MRGCLGYGASLSTGGIAAIVICSVIAVDITCSFIYNLVKTMMKIKKMIKMNRVLDY